MGHDPPSGLKDSELLQELEENSREILDLAHAPRRISAWDKSIWGLGAGFAIAGAVLTGPLTLAGLLLSLGGLGLVGVDMGKKVADLRGDQEILARLRQLQIRNAALWREWHRRRP